MKTFQGSIVALATPFRDGQLDVESYRRLIRHQLSEGTQGLVPIGTTGEASTMSRAEKAQAVQVAVEEAKGKAFVIGGAGANGTAETIELVKQVRDAGADGTLVVTPYYNKPTQAGMVEHYRAIAKAHPGFPIVVYNVPGRTGVDLLPETCERLGEIPEVVAIKEATASMIRAIDIVERCGDRLTLLSGDDFTILPFIACGGRGVISVSANVVPEKMRELVDASRSGDRKRALEVQVALNPLHRLLFVESNPIPVKWALHLMGLFGPEIRLPLTPMTPANAAKLREELGRLGVLR